MSDAPTHSIAISRTNITITFLWGVGKTSAIARPKMGFSAIKRRINQAVNISFSNSTGF
jgi:hypothetical protein